MSFSNATSSAPIARKADGPDPYAWLQNRDTDEVLDYLKAENAWQEQQLAEQTGLRESLFEEIKGRILETDLSLPSPGARTFITPEPHKATNTPVTTAARARPTTATRWMKAPRNCCSTLTRWPMAAFSRWVHSASALTTSVWPTAWTPVATRCTSFTSRN